MQKLPRARQAGVVLSTPKTRFPVVPGVPARGKNRGTLSKRTLLELHEYATELAETEADPIRIRR